MAMAIVAFREHLLDRSFRQFGLEAVRAVRLLHTLGEVLHRSIIPAPDPPKAPKANGHKSPYRAQFARPQRPSGDEAENIARPAAARSQSKRTRRRCRCLMRIPHKREPANLIYANPFAACSNRSAKKMRGGNPSAQAASLLGRGQVLCFLVARNTNL